MNQARINSKDIPFASSNFGLRSFNLQSQRKIIVYSRFVEIDFPVVNYAARCKNSAERWQRPLSTWMVVEDEPDIYEVLLAMFGIWGIEGVAFVDGEEAISWIDDVDNKRFQGELPELALLDIRLPGDIDGPGVGARLRQSSALKNVAIVLTTAYHLTPDEEKTVIKKADADRLIYKPLPKFNELQTVLEGIIAERREKTRNTASD